MQVQILLPAGQPQAMPGGQVLQVVGQVGVPSVPHHAQHGVQAHEEDGLVKATPAQRRHEVLSNTAGLFLTLNPPELSPAGPASQPRPHRLTGGRSCGWADQDLARQGTLTGLWLV